jgi:hypothetical protein
MKTRVHSPFDLATAYADYFNAGDLRGLLSLYDPNAVLRTDDGRLVQHAELERAHAENPALGVPIQITGQRVITAGGLPLALIMTEWTMRGVDPSGNWVSESGESTDVAVITDTGIRYAIDNPRGTHH